MTLKFTPGPDLWQSVHAPFQVCLAFLGLWQLPQSVRAGCVNTNFAPVAWQTVQSLPRSTCFGLWQSEHLEAAMS